MMYAPEPLGAAGNPIVLGSMGHMIIQCGPILIVGFDGRHLCRYMTYIMYNVKSP